MTRNDLAFPFRIAGGSGQAAQANYQDHVDQLIRQVLLTDPGERVNLPQFGAGLRRLLFAPINSSALTATTKMTVTQALKQWIPNQINVLSVEVTTSDENSSIPDGTIQIVVSYQLVETRAPRRTVVLIS
jgi:phage baseplate assembly protein W